ncbi:RAP domain-containing protein [Plasmodiophora brassicae]
MAPPVQAQWAVLNTLRTCTTAKHVRDLIHKVHSSGQATDLSAETLATTCQTLCRLSSRERVPYRMCSATTILVEWVRERLAANRCTPVVAAKLLQASQILLRDERPGTAVALIDLFKQGIDSMDPGPFIGGVIAISNMKAPLRADESLWSAVVRRGEPMLSDVSASELAKFVGAIVRVGLVQEPVIPLFKKASEKITELGVDGMATGRLAELVWALSRTGTLPYEFARTVVADRVISEMSFLTPQLMSQFVCSMAHSAVCPRRLYDALENRLQAQLAPESPEPSSYSTQSLANMAWSMAVARRPALMPNLWRVLQERSDITIGELCQTFQSMTYANLCAEPGAIALPPDQDPDLVDLRYRCREAFFDDQPLQATSDIHLSVVKAAFETWPGAVQVEEQCSKTGYWLDFALPKKRMAWEVNGPHHYCRLSMRMRGASLLKKSIVVAAGWDFRSIPYYDWTFGKANMEGKVNYLKMSAMPTGKDVGARRTRRTTSVNKDFVENVSPEEGAELGAHGHPDTFADDDDVSATHNSTPSNACTATSPVSEITGDDDPPASEVRDSECRVPC